MSRCVRQGGKNHFCCVGAGGAAGFAGCDFVCDGVKPCSTDFGPVRRDAYTESVIDVIRNVAVAHAVALVKAVAAPRGPNAVWLPMPPNAAEMSPLCPLCSSTTMMRNKQTMM